MRDGLFKGTSHAFNLHSPRKKMRCLDSEESINLLIMSLTLFLKQLMQAQVEVFFPGSCLHRGDVVEHSDYQFSAMHVAVSPFFQNHRVVRLVDIPSSEC